MEPALPSPVGIPTDPEPVQLTVEPVRGGFWRRAAAYLLDFFLIEMIVILFLTIGGLAIETANAQVSGMDLLSSAVMDSFLPLFSSIFLSYFTFFHYWGGQTPGKLLMKLRVVSKNLEELTLLRAFGRSLCYFLSSLFLGLGFLIAAIDRDKRALHDFIAQTRVVRL